MQFSVSAFNAMLGGIGQKVSWRRATSCPCRNPFSGAADSSCPVCAGLGTVWAGSISAWTGLAGQRATQQFAASGNWQDGDVVLTIPSDSPLYAIGKSDRVEFLQSSQPFDYVVLPSAGDRMTFLPQFIERVCWIADGALVDGDQPQVAPDGTIFWTAQALRPPPGVQYTIAGRRAPEYFCFTEIPQDRAHNNGLALPRKVQIRKFSLFGLSGAPGSIGSL